MSDDLWGPWVDHDGKGCPCAGQWTHMVAVNPAGKEIEKEGIAQKSGASWTWRIADGYEGPIEFRGTLYLRVPKIIRYRVRKPRGLAILQDLIENLPASVREREDA